MSTNATTPAAASGEKHLVDVLPLLEVEVKIRQHMSVKNRAAANHARRAMDSHNQDAAFDAAEARRLTSELLGMELALSLVSDAIGPVVCVLTAPKK